MIEKQPRLVEPHLTIIDVEQSKLDYWRTQKRILMQRVAILDGYIGHSLEIMKEQREIIGGIVEGVDK